MVEFARPLVQRVVRRRFFSSRGANPEDQEDVCADAVAAIIGRVKALRASADHTAIADFGAYAAGIASRAAGRFFMARTPQKTLLRNRIRYVLTTDKRFRIRQSDHGTWQCSLAGKSELTAVLSDTDVEKCRARIASTQSAPGKLPETVLRILTVARGALELSALTSLAAEVLGISDRTETVDALEAGLVSREPGAAHQAEMRQRIRELWREVCELPVPQRRALLLNLGSTGAAGTQATAWLIPDLGIATFRGLAEELEMTAEELAEFWNRLPIPDSEIASRFGLRRQQVINLRSAARERLSRRMAI
jgi:hypothetical protein